MLNLTPSQVSEIIGVKEIELLVTKAELAAAQAKIAELEAAAAAKKKKK